MNLGLFLRAFPNDSGPIYQETVQGRFPVEPFNTFSNLFFLIIIIYFSVRVYKDPNKHKFLAWMMPFLLLSYIGGTVYHATRSGDFWMYLDWLPIVGVCLAASVYFTALIKTSWKGRLWLILIILFLVVGNRLLPWPVSLKTSAGYMGTALGLVLPIFVYMYTEHFKNWQFIVFGILSFGAAISFRIMDRFVYILPMGTHWLWHSFGALAVFLMISYIYRDRLIK